MGDKTGIEWTDATWNPLAGCSIVSPACTNCYAMKMAARIEAMSYGGAAPKSHYEGLTQPSKAGPVWTGKIVYAPDHILTAPLRWRRPRKIFVNSMSDLFHKDVETWKIAEIYGTMIAAHHLHGHILQFLTKRSDRMREVLSSESFWDEANAFTDDYVMSRVDPHSRRSDDARATLEEYSPSNPPPGIWAGVTAEDQTRADERIPDLLATPAAKRFSSCEPLLGALNLTQIRIAGEPHSETHNALTGYSSDTPYGLIANGLPDRFGRGRLDWVIAGGESGANARPSHPDWFRSLRDRCAAAGVPFFFKQWGEWAPASSHGYHRRSANCRYGEFHTPDGEWVESCLCKEGGKDAQMLRVGKACAGSFLDNRKHKEFPQ